MYMANIKDFKKIDRIEELGNKICKFAEYYAKEKGPKVLALAALADILFNFREIFRSYDKRFKELEEHNLEHQEINETGGINNIKIILDDQDKKERRRIKK